MKTFFALVFATGVLMSAHADIPAPKQTVVTVTNLTAFPKYKFTYHTEGEQKSKPIREGQPFTAYQDVQLLVQNEDDSPQVWEKVKYDWRGSNVAIRIDAVKQDGKTITVTSKVTSGTAGSGKKSAAAIPQSLRLFAVTGIGACGLVLLARRRKAA